MSLTEWLVDAEKAGRSASAVVRLDEQAKSYEDKVADGLRENEDLESEAGVLQAQLEKQLGINWELEVRLAGMKKLEEEAKKNEPGTEVLSSFPHYRTHPYRFIKLSLSFVFTTDPLYL